MRLLAGMCATSLKLSKPIVALMQSRRTAVPVSRSPENRQANSTLNWAPFRGDSLHEKDATDQADIVSIIPHAAAFP
jgi:hypothetical protein